MSTEKHDQFTADHCRPATINDYRTLAAIIDRKGPIEDFSDRWWVLTRSTDKMPELYGASAITLIVPAGLHVDGPRTFHGRSGHSTVYTIATINEMDRALRESVDRAIACAGNTSEYATQESALSWLLECAWYDLQSARRMAANGVWSMGCDDQVSRIIGLTMLIGPMSWRNICVDLLADGIYERIHEAAGTPTPLTHVNWQIDGGGR